MAPHYELLFYDTIRYEMLWHVLTSDRIVIILQPFNGLFLQDNLGKPVPER